MSGYRFALDHTSGTLAIRARNFRNLVVAFVVIGLASVGGVLARFSLWPASGLLLLAPAYGAFLWRDSVILGRWRAQLCEAWTRRAIDFSALRHALNAHPTLPQSTVKGMLDTLPAAGNLTAEQAVSASTREAIVRGVKARDDYHTDTLSFRAAGLTIAAAAIMFAIMLSRWTPLFAFALLPALAIVWKWRHRRRMGRAVAAVKALTLAEDFNGDRYREILNPLEWDGSSSADKKLLLTLPTISSPEWTGTTLERPICLSRPIV